MSTDWNTKLRTHILSRPELADDVAAGRDATIAGKLNAANDPSRTMLAPGSWLTERGVLDLLGPVDGDAALTALEAVAQTNSVVARAVRLLKDVAGGGIDFGTLAVQAQVAALRDASVLTPAAAGKLIAYGRRACGLAAADKDIGRDVTADEVSSALAVDRVTFRLEERKEDGSILAKSASGQPVEV